MKKTVLSIGLIFSILLPNISLAAIGFDTAVRSSEVSASSVTWSHTIGTNDNRLIVVIGRWAGAVTDLSSVTVDGNAATIDGMIDLGGNVFTFMAHYLTNTLTGAKNITVNLNASRAALIAGSASYYGVNQTGNPESKASSSCTSATTCSVSTSTVTNNSWFIGVSKNFDHPGTTSTMRLSETGSGSDFNFIDLNGPVTPAGNATLIATTSPATNGVMIGATFAPDSQPTVSTRKIRGVGITR
jgi:hypothetical protein